MSFRNYPRIDFSATSESYTTPHQLKAGYSHEVSFPSAFIRIWSPLPLGLPHPVRSAHRLSQPHSDLLLQIHTSPVSCWIRPWDFTLQSFFLSSRCNIFQYHLPSWCFYYLPGYPGKPSLDALISYGITICIHKPFQNDINRIRRFSFNHLVAVIHMGRIRKSFPLHVSTFRQIENTPKNERISSIMLAKTQMLTSCFKSTVQSSYLHNHHTLGHVVVSYP